jgi:hypothetical protein
MPGHTETEIYSRKTNMKKILILLLVAALMTGCTQPDKASSILKRDGYQNIELTGYKWFACSEDDFFHTGFKATKNGQEVEGVVCSEWFKGSTVRTFN